MHGWRASHRTEPWARRHVRGCGINLSREALGVGSGPAVVASVPSVFFELDIPTLCAPSMYIVYGAELSSSMLLLLVVESMSARLPCVLGR